MRSLSALATLLFVALCLPAAKAAQEYTACSSLHGCCNTIGQTCKLSDGYTLTATTVGYYCGNTSLGMELASGTSVEETCLVPANDGCWYQLFEDGGATMNTPFLITNETSYYYVYMNGAMCLTYQNKCTMPDGKATITIIPVTSDCESGGMALALKATSTSDLIVVTCLATFGGGQYGTYVFISGFGASTENYSFCPIRA